MNEKIYCLAKEINDELNNNPLVIRLNELEKELNDSYEIYLLSNKKDEALEKYLSNKDLYGDNHKLTIEAQKVLMAAKKELQLNPLVKEYLEVYSKVRDMYLEINHILLDDFKGEKC